MEMACRAGRSSGTNVSMCHKRLWDAPTTGVPFFPSDIPREMETDTVSPVSASRGGRGICTLWLAEAIKSLKWCDCV